MLTSAAFAFEVAEEDIEKGLPHHPNKCPVACALLRQGFTHITVYSDRVSFLNPETDVFHQLNTSAELNEFITAVDSREELSPQVFYLDFDPY